jgi:hypothetical protein
MPPSSPSLFLPISCDSIPSKNVSSRFTGHILCVYTAHVCCACMYTVHVCCACMYTVHVACIRAPLFNIPVGAHAFPCLPFLSKLAPGLQTHGSFDMPYLVLPCHILPCHILFCLVLSCLALSCLDLPSLVACLVSTFPVLWLVLSCLSCLDTCLVIVLSLTCAMSCLAI